MKYKGMHVTRLCVAILIVLLVFIAQLAIADTDVGGNITEDTTWTKGNSPYIVTSTVQVLEGVKLTIETGVLIRVDPYSNLIIGGELIAIGTPGDMITFTYNGEGVPPDGIWGSILIHTSAKNLRYDENGNYIEGSIIRYCAIQYAGLSAYSGIEFSNSTINNARHAMILTGGDNNTYFVIKNNTISDASIYGISIQNCEAHFLISKNRIINNTTGLSIWGRTNVDLYYNQIEGNKDCGLEVYTSVDGFTQNIKYNNIINNGWSNIDNSAQLRLSSGGNDLDVSNNYWGNTDPTTIDEGIIDYYDNIGYEKAIYQPIASQPFDFTGGSISGTVTDISTGVAISNATISSNIGVQVSTNNSGKYLLENISPGDYTLTITAPLYHSATIENVTVSAGETTTFNVFLDPKTTGTVAGKVVSAEGLTPITNVTVQISNGTYTSSVNSDTNGNFTFGDITYGDYTIEIISPSYWGTSQNITVPVDEIIQVTLVGIPQSIVDDIRSGWFTQDQLNQAVADAETAKDVIIAEKDQTISGLNSIIASMFTQDQLNQAVTSAETAKDVIIAQKDQTITDLNSTIASMFTQQQLNQAVADAEVAKDAIIAQKEQTISELNTTIAAMFTQEQLNQAVADAEAAKDVIIAEKNQTITDLNSNIASMFSQEQIDQAVLNERQRWDINGDNKISLEEAIHALQVVSGIRTQ